jgi:hypothetical protein
MTVEKFVETEAIDPVYYDWSYFLAPDGQAGVYSVSMPSCAKPSPRPARPRCPVS